MTDLNKASQEFWLTQAQYDTRKNAGTLVVGAIYHITDVSYENTSNKVTSISSSSTDTQYPSAKCVYDEVSTISTNKADRVASATSGNFAGLNSSGNLTDSGYDATDFITTDNSVLSNPVSINADTLNNHPDTYFATASQISTLQQDKVDKPTAQTPANYVPTSNGQGGYTWSAQQGGGGFPASPSAGDAVVYDGTSWAKQSGYGYSISQTLFDGTFNVDTSTLDDGFYGTPISWLEEIVVGDRYKVTINGTAHELVAFDFLGAKMVMDGTPSFTEEKNYTFYLIDGDGQKGFVSAESYGTSFTLKVETEHTSKIDNKYIPSAFVVTIALNESFEFAADKTFEEVQTAISDGIPIICVVNILGDLIQTQNVNSSEEGMTFSFISPDAEEPALYHIFLTLSSDNTVTYKSGTVSITWDES